MKMEVERTQTSIFSISGGNEKKNIYQVDNDIELVKARVTLASARSNIEAGDHADLKSQEENEAENENSGLFKFFAERRPYSRKVYIAFLMVAFGYSISRSLFHVLAEPTTVEETIRSYNATFPSLTCCLKDTQKDHFTTFQEVYDGIHKLFENDIRANLKILGIGVEK